MKGGRRGEEREGEGGQQVFVSFELDGRGTGDVRKL